jgi:hypothetical protein
MGQFFLFKQGKQEGDVIAAVGGFLLQVICRQTMLLLEVLIEKLRLTSVRRNFPARGIWYLSSKAAVVSLSISLGPQKLPKILTASAIFAISS